jgi:hypothetical protein
MELELRSWLKFWKLMEMRQTSSSVVLTVKLFMSLSRWYLNTAKYYIYPAVLVLHMLEVEKYKECIQFGLFAHPKECLVY